MPFYEYRCGSCGHEFEAMQKMNDDPLTHCPGCAEDELVKLISAAGFRLKGGGWYETDFKKNGSKKNVAETGSSPSSGGHSCGTGTCSSCS
ncbi:MAG: zinc ribbon domain-containing protein [Sedimenticolaceae bacterium]|jgi:putative FmdB family regulatory protein